MRRKRKRAAELRQAIDCLPEHTRTAMLEGIESNQIIVGAYTDDQRGHDTGERDRTPELRNRHGWAWLRAFRRYDEYEDALERAVGDGERDRELESTRV